MALTILIMLLINFVPAFFSIIGLVNYYNGSNTFLIIAASLSAVGVIYQFIKGKISNFLTVILCCVIAMIQIKSFWTGVAVGLCYENIFSTFLGLLLFAFAFISSKLK